MQGNVATKSDLEPSLGRFLEAWKCEKSKLGYFSNFSSGQIAEISKLVGTELHKVKLLLGHLESFSTCLGEYRTQMSILKKMSEVRIRNSQKPVFEGNLNPVTVFRPFYNPHNNPDFYRISRETLVSMDLTKGKKNLNFQGQLQVGSGSRSFVEDGKGLAKKNWHNYDPSGGNGPGQGLGLERLSKLKGRCVSEVRANLGVGKN